MNTRRRKSNLVRKRANHRCELCGRFVPHELPNGSTACSCHHILPAGQWYKYRLNLANMLCLCGDCHHGIHNGRHRELGQKALDKIHREEASGQFLQAVRRAVATGVYYKYLPNRKHLF